MEFDKSRVYTALNADELKAGDKVFYADVIGDLEEWVDNDIDTACGHIEKINNKDCEYRFKIKDENSYQFVYLVEKAKEKNWRPYESIDEFVSDFIKRFNITCPNYAMPFIWIKPKRGNNDKLFVTSYFCDDAVIAAQGLRWSLEELYEDYTYLDGTPCGKEIED